MTSVTVHAPAKINLSLGVGGLRDDGFHTLATVYQAIDLHDEVRATRRDDGHIGVSVVSEIDLAEDNHVPVGDDNLAVRAARHLRDHLIARGDDAAGFGVDLAIRKVIPVAGGMAGGSADAAAALVACNALWGAGLDRSTLETLAADLGSDVPFAVRGGTAAGSGRGETLHPVLARGVFHWVVATSAAGLPTPEVFRTFDALSDAHAADPVLPDALLEALAAGDAEALGAALTNDLQAAALSLRPGLQRTLDVGLAAGALGAVVSGSGPTCVFLAASPEHGLDIAVALASAADTADVLQTTGPAAGAEVV